MSYYSFAKNLLLRPYRRRRRERGLRNAYEALRRFPSDRVRQTAFLPAPLVVSLTSYAKRFDNLALTIKSLLEQDMIFDRLVLWLTPEDEALLPDDVRGLAGPVFEIRTAIDVRSFKKLIPALAAFPDAFIATADDDLYYPPHWLRRLAETYRDHGPAIVCHRAHHARFLPDGSARPYKDWVYDASGTRARDRCSLLFPTGVGGILYPPHSLDPEVVNQDAFMALCSHADDVWFFWMGHLAGSRYVQVPEYFDVIEWPGSQVTALYRHNVADDGNDRQISAVQARYGAVGPKSN